MTARGRTHGDRRRSAILEAAVDVASAEGLEGLSLARLASEVEMTKSGVFAHFESKEDLQMAAIAAAADAFERRVLQPILEREPGLERLRALVETWLGYIEKVEYRGGCFFAAASAEFSGRSGQVQKELARLTGGWVARLESEARTAVRLGELPQRSDPAQLAFQIHAYVQEANWRRETLGDRHAFARARRAIAAALGPVATAPPRRNAGK